MTKAADLQGGKLDLIQLRLVGSILHSRWPQLLLRLITLGGFLLAILTGLLGTPVGSRNFAIVFVWIAWWALLMLLAVPLLGRGWCSLCPLPLPGEWLQQGALLRPQGPGMGFGKRWPKPLRNIWLQNGAFTLLALFSTVILTQPGVSSLLLLALLLIATGTSLIFERRAFCNYLCPVGGFIGLFSQAAPIELRVKDSKLCAKHTPKTCFTGNNEGYGCPWGVFPAGLLKNTSCGLCLECLRTCPYDNIALYLRQLGADLDKPTGRKLDEAFKGFIMLGSAIVYSTVLLGPWNALKTSAYQVGSLSWFEYALSFLVFVFLLLPGSFALAVVSGQSLSGLTEQNRRKHLRSDFIQLAYSLVPLGLAGWIAFSMSFVFANLSYLWPVLSDPFGWGWDLLGTSDLAWTPYLTQLIPLLQALVLIGGMAWASRSAFRIAGQILERKRNPQPTNLIPSAARLAFPIIMFCLGITVGMMGLLIS